MTDLKMKPVPKQKDFEAQIDQHSQKMSKKIQSEIDMIKFGQLINKAENAGIQQY